MSYPLFHPANPETPPMVQSRAEFEAAFPAESQYVERKGGIGGRALQEAVVAFSNADGGVILIGVDDAGRLVGKELTQAVAESLHQTVGEVHSPGRYEVVPLMVDRIPVVVLSVAKRIEGFAQTSNGRVLVRRGPRNVPLIGSDLREFISSRSLGRFEREPTTVPVAEVGTAELEQLRQTFKWSDDAEVVEHLIDFGLAADGARGPVLTIAGAMLLLDSPRIVVPKAYIEVLRFRGPGHDYDRRVELDGPAYRQVEQATRLVADELGTELVVLGLHRHELPRLPTVVVREAIANAVAHRSYELSGSSVRIEIRPDVVEITSPGGLPEPVTVKNIRDTNAARNPDLIGVLRRMGLAEDIGRGVDVMQDAMMEDLLEPPRFEDLGHAVRVTLPIRGTVSPRERAWVRELEGRGELTPRDRILLVHAARGDVLTNATARKLLGVDSVHARQALRRLRDGGFLDQTGVRGGASYHLSESIQPPVGFRLRPDELEAYVLDMAGDGPLTNRAVRDRTGLDRVDALRILDSLTAKGKLVRRGERRGAHYMLPPARPGGIDFDA